MITLILASLTLSDAIAKDIKVPSLPITVTIPDLEEGILPEQIWGHSLGDPSSEVKLGLRNSARFTNITFRGTEYQLDPEKIRPNLVEWMEQSVVEDIKLFPGEPRIIEHEHLGKVVLLPAPIPRPCRCCGHPSRET